MDHHWLARTGPVRAVLWTGGQALLSNARRQTMFERFSDRARRVVVLAQEEARRLDHNYIGTEHILLGLIREGNGVAAQVLVKLGAGPCSVSTASTRKTSQPDRRCGSAWPGQHRRPGSLT
jgi:hypothetical protein